MYDRAILSQLVNERVRGIRYLMPRAKQKAQKEVLEGKVMVKDAFSACRFVARILYNTHDPEYVRTVDDETLYFLLKEGTIGAAQYRLRKEQGHKDEGREKKDKRS